MAKSIKLLTIADGFGDSSAYPAWYPSYIKWPEIIQLMTKGVALTNQSRYGAGNEYIANCIKSYSAEHDVIIVQWAIPARLDLVLDHALDYQNFWTDTIKQDLVYNNNVVNLKDTQFWISSASTSKPIQKYHEKYITVKQHQMRSQILIDYAKLLLEYQCKSYKFLLTSDSEYLDTGITGKDCWAWHDIQKGMHDFRYRSKFAELDLGITQPIPLIAFDFIKQFLMPVLALPWRESNELAAVESMLYRKYQEAIKNKPI
jgi:hypothetical protein